MEAATRPGPNTLHRATRRLGTAYLALASLLSWAATPTLAAAEGAPKHFQGTWSLDIDATTLAIANDESLPAEARPMWEREATKLRLYDVVITDDAIERRVRTEETDRRRDGAPEVGAWLVELQESGPEHAVLVMNNDPRHCGDQPCPPERERFFHLRLRDDGSLQLRERRARGWDRDDALFAHFVLRRQEGDLAPPRGNANDAVAYLDALKTCEPGRFTLASPFGGQLQNTIQGTVDGLCQVEMVLPNVRLACRLSGETLALMTSPAKYDQARTGVFEGSTESPESQRLGMECSPQ